MNKKAYIGESLVNLWAILLIILVIIGFWFLFNISGFTKRGVKQIVESEKISESSKVLIDYLRSDLYVDGEKMNFADLIALSYLSYGPESYPGYGPEVLRSKTIEFMKENDLCFDLVIHLFDLPGGELEFARRIGSDVETKIKISSLCSDISMGRKRQYESYAFIPVLSQLVKVGLTLYE